jgi:3D (Asp-Asp-Asp) domain-containing protein
LRHALAIALTLLTCIPASAAGPKKVGRAIITFYWTVDESSLRYLGRRSAVLRDPAGHVIAQTTQRFKIALVRQGTGVLRDGRVVVYIRKVGGESRFRVTRSQNGLSSTGCPLVPYRTVAVDPRFVKLGSRIYIPQFKGAKLPDGTIHDGMFIASDRGRFRGAHIDLFTGVGPRSVRPFTRHGHHSRSHVTVNLAGRASGCRP